MFIVKMACRKDGAIGRFYTKEFRVVPDMGESIREAWYRVYSSSWGAYVFPREATSQGEHLPGGDKVSTDYRMPEDHGWSDCEACYGNGHVNGEVCEACHGQGSYVW